MRVLLIEDDSATAHSIELMLKSEGFNVFTTDLGEEGVDLGKLYDYEIILLDLSLPDMSGYEVLRALRVSKVKTPILILSGTTGIEDKVKGLGFGADDYMTKPFHKDELVARIHAIVRRSKGHAQSVVQTGDLIVDLDAKIGRDQRRSCAPYVKEYQMLELLSLRKGTTLTKEMFLNQLYGGMDEPEIKIIDVFICKLRKKLAGASDGKDYIETVWGRGYVLREPDEEMAKSSSLIFQKSPAMLSANYPSSTFLVGEPNAGNLSGLPVPELVQPGAVAPLSENSPPPIVTAIRARRMQKDQLRAAHTIPPSHSGRQASSRRPCCHKESAVASRLPNLAGRESTERHRRQLCVSETSLSAPPIEAQLNQPACRQSCDCACGAWCLGSSQSTQTWRPSWPWPRRE